MFPADISPVDLGVIALYGLLVLAPGLAVGAAGGLRGWTLVASAPLVTYALAGLFGPWATALGVGWNPLVLVTATVVAAAVLAAVRYVPGWYRRIADAPDPERPRWSRTEQVGAAAAVSFAVVVGGLVVLGGIRRLTTIPQDWDAVFHANGIRWIADTGDAGLFAMSRVNWYEDGGIFYPNAYHLVASTVYQLTGRDIPTVLNAHTVLIPGLIALVLAGVVRRFGGSGLHAAGTALAAVSLTPVYDMLWRGPLLPYATGVAVTPAVLLLLAEFLDAGPARQRIANGLLLALGAAGLVCLHPAMLFGAVLLAVPFLGWRWSRRPARLRREPALLIPAGLVAVALSFAQFRGALNSASGFPPLDWPADLTYSQSIWALLTFSHASGMTQSWLVVPAVVGLLTYHRLGELRWIALPVAAFGTLFVLAASSDAPWVNAITRPWWNDRWRLIGVFAVLMCIVIGHGLAQIHRAILATLRASSLWVRANARSTVLTGSVAAAVLLGFVLASHTLYLARNAERMSFNTGDGPAISSDEVAGIRHLASIVGPQARVLNDRGDGSVWMYALTGVRPVAGHYDDTGLADTDAGLLAGGFNRYATDPAVRAAVDRLDVQYVMVGEGFLRYGAVRSPGLTNLAGAPYLATVYRSPDVAIYQIRIPAPGPDEPT